MHAHCCFIGCSSLRERNAKSLESDRRKKVASGNSLRKRRRRRSACSPSSPNYNLLIYIPANCTFPRATFPAVIFALINRTRRSFLRDRQIFSFDPGSNRGTTAAPRRMDGFALVFVRRSFVSFHVPSHRSRTPDSELVFEKLDSTAGRFRPLIPPQDGREITMKTFRPFTKRAARIPTVSV